MEQGAIEVTKVWLCCCKVPYLHCHTSPGPWGSLDLPTLSLGIADGQVEFCPSRLPYTAVLDSLLLYPRLALLPSALPCLPMPCLALPYHAYFVPLQTHHRYSVLTHPSCTLYSVSPTLLVPFS